MAIRGLRASLNSIVPNWLSNRRGLNTGFKVLYTIALMGDVLLEQGLEGLRAAWPGKGTPSALPLIGQSRGIIQGESELESSYAARLRAWLTTWMNAGSDQILASQIQSYLANNPTVRIVDRNSNWTILNPDGSVTQINFPWNWDGTSGFDDTPASVTANWWSDIWIIVYPTEWPIEPITAGTLDPLHGIDHLVTPTTASTILNLVDTWKGAHTFVRAIIWTYSATSFNPIGPPGVMPDGTYGKWYKIDATGTAVQSRDTDSRYWEPFNGG